MQIGTLENKHIETVPNVHPLISKRWSTRAFSPKGIDNETILALFEAARWAPSSYNDQPWRFIYATSDNAEAHGRLASCLVPGNIEWASKAPLLVAAVVRKNYAHNGKPYKHAWHDLGLALGNLTLEATHRDIYLRQMGGFMADKLREDFQIPDHYEPATMIALGYKGESSDLPELFQSLETKERQRLPLSQIAFDGFFKS